MIRRLSISALALACALGAWPAPEASAQRVRTIPVNVESSPDGAAVYLDTTEGQPIGTTPLRNVRIPRGQHTLIFKKELHEETRLVVDIRRRRETFRAELPALATISISGTDQASNGAAVRIDGEPVGNVPHIATVQPGRHLVQVGREGYVTFAQWVQLAGGQAMQLPVTLQPEAPSTGSILVAGDTTGAAIYIDGTPRGSTPSVIEGIPEGEHVIKVESSQPGLQPFEQTVRIIAGERVTLNPTLRPAPAATGGLRVLVRPREANATVSIDGEVIGEAPAAKEGITPGEHIVEVAADGFELAQQPVTIESGANRVISVQLTRQAAAPGRIVVNANVAGATVTIDGEDRGAPPIVIENAPDGTHAIVVRAPGYQEFRHTCAVGSGHSCEIVAELDPVGAPVRVEATDGTGSVVQGAEFLVDGEVLGPIPWEGTVPTGSHRIEVRAEGYRPHVEVLALEAEDDLRLINVGLVPEGQMTPEERAEAERERRARHRQAVARSGAPLPNDIAVLDFSLGWPYLFELRMGIGILPWLDAGIGIRTLANFRVTEFEGRVKAGFRPVEQVSLGAQFKIGGGIGPAHDDPTTENEDGDPVDPMGSIGSLSTNDFFFALEGLFTLHFAKAGNFTLWGALDFHSDEYLWAGDNNDCRYVSGCTGRDGTDVDIALDRAIANDPVFEGRQNLARFRLGGSLEFIIANNWNMWLSFEGVFGEGRRMLGDIWGGDREDIEIYTRLGFTYKFGYTDD